MNSQSNDHVTEAMLLHELDEIKRLVGEVKDEVRATNGRVRTLEMFKAQMIAVGGIAVLIAVNLGAWIALVK